MYLLKVYKKLLNKFVYFLPNQNLEMEKDNNSIITNDLEILEFKNKLRLKFFKELNKIENCFISFSSIYIQCTQLYHSILKCNNLYDSDDSSESDEDYTPNNGENVITKTKLLNDINYIINKLQENLIKDIFYNYEKINNKKITNFIDYLIGIKDDLINF